MSVVSRRLLFALVSAVLCAAVVASPGALAQTSSGTATSGGITKDTPAPTAVEPQAGQAAPPVPGQTTPTVETTTTTTAPGTTGGVTIVEGKVVTAGGVPAGSSSNSGTSWTTIAGIVLAAIILFVALVIVLWQWRGWDPRWLRRWRHASAEAGWRLSLGWAEFRDFVRIGR